MHWVLFIIACLQLQISDAFVPSFGRCNATTTPDPRFNIIFFSIGPWYEVARTSLFLSTCPSVGYFYVPLLRIFTTTFTGRITGLGNIRIDAIARGNQTEAGIFEFQTFLPPISLPRITVIRVEDQYAVKYMCINFGFIKLENYSIVTRNRIPPDAVMQNAVDYLVSRGVNRRLVRFSTQTNCT